MPTLSPRTEGARARPVLHSGISSIAESPRSRWTPILAGMSCPILVAFTLYGVKHLKITKKWISRMSLLLFWSIGPNVSDYEFLARMAILIGLLQVLPSKMSYRIASVDRAPAVYQMCSRCLDDLGGQKSQPSGKWNLRGGFPHFLDFIFSASYLFTAPPKAQWSRRWF